jgi:hypothetical protein
MNRSAFLLSTLALIAAAAPAHADDWQVGIGTSLRHHGSPSLDPLAADDSHSAFAIGGGRRLPGLDVAGFQLGADLQLEVGSIDGVTFQRIDTHTGLITGLAGARAERRLSRRWSALARVALGVTRVNVELRDAGSATGLADRRWAGTAYLGGGIDLAVLGADRDRGLGLRAEVGYLAATPVDLHARASGGTPPNPIPAQETDLGRLDVSAWVLRIGAVGRF